MKQRSREERYRILNDPEEVRALHDQILKSDYRQTFHVQPVTGLLNDPNAFVYLNNTWHLFYQWCPWGAFHGLKYWYHVQSKDLITWENKGVYIKPDTIYDNKGAYSGTAMPIYDDLYLFYTGNHRDENWVRKSYTCVVKIDANGQPVKMSHPIFGPNENYTEHQRDPKIFYHHGKKKYYIFIGAQTKEGFGCCLVYESSFLTSDWKFAGQLKVPGFEYFGGMWECPAIEHIGDKDVFIFCPQHIVLPGRGDNTNHCGYIIGHMDYDTLTFNPISHFHVLDFGFDFYAAQCASSTFDADKKTMIGWMGLPDSEYPTEPENWEGCMTLPREIRISEDNDHRLVQKPSPALKKLRDKKIKPEGLLPRVCEIDIFVGAGDFDLNLFTRKDGSGGIKLHFDSIDNDFEVDRSDMDKPYNINQGVVRVHPLEEPLYRLQVYIDKSSIEIFVNDGDSVFTTRVFPDAEDEHYYTITPNARVRMWTLKPSVEDNFVI